MASLRKFHRTVIVVEILSEDILDDPTDLASVAAQMLDTCSGEVKKVIRRKIDGPTAARLLVAQGADPAFFDLTDDGEDR